MVPNFPSIIRNFRILWFIYQQHFGVTSGHAIPITQVNPVPIRKSRYDFIRFNLMVPSLNSEHLFGGIATAVRLFKEVIQKKKDNLKFRIILTDAGPEEEAHEIFPGFKSITPNQDSDANYQMVNLADKKRPELTVMRNDLFFATAWWTACLSQDINRAQSEIYGQALKKMVYIIQDYEPAFYNWSSHFMLAEATYRSEIPTIAVFNSSLLSDFFKDGGYKFYKTYEFEPRLNETLRKYFDPKASGRKNQIACYGRPSTDRNCFSLIVGGLRKWVEKDTNVVDWKIVSVGEDHPPVDLGNGITMTSKGKLSLEAYARLLSESAVGLSLMASPHPSYPPLEMAHFGMLTITNSFFNKDLSQLHDNITSIQHVTPDSIAMAISKAVRVFTLNPEKGAQGQSRIPDYCEKGAQFPFLNDFINDILE